MNRDSEFERVFDVAEGIKEWEDWEKRKDKFLVDWADNQEVAIYKQEVRDKKRTADLDRVVPDRKCPLCKVRVYLNSSWVVKGGRACCRSCNRDALRYEGKTVEVELLKDVILRYSLRPMGLLRLRKATKTTVNREGCWTQQRLGQKLGVSTAYISNLEKGKQHSINEETFDSLVKAFTMNGQKAEDVVTTLVDCKEVRVVYSPWKLKLVRTKLGVGLQSMAFACGWSPNYQRILETTDNARTLGVATFKTILDYLESLSDDKRTVVILDSP